MNDLIILLQFADIPPVLFDFLPLLLRKCCSAAALLQGRQASRLLLLLPISTRLLIFLFLWNAALADLFFMHGGGYGWQFVVFAFADVGEGGRPDRLGDVGRRPRRRRRLRSTRPRRIRARVQAGSGHLLVHSGTHAIKTFFCR